MMFRIATEHSLQEWQSAYLHLTLSRSVLLPPSTYYLQMLRTNSIVPSLSKIESTRGGLSRMLKRKWLSFRNTLKISRPPIFITFLMNSLEFSKYASPPPWPVNRLHLFDESLPIILASICVHWQNVTLSTPSFWSTIIIGHPQTEVVASDGVSVCSTRDDSNKLLRGGDISKLKKWIKRQGVFTIRLYPLYPPIVKPTFGTDGKSHKICSPNPSFGIGG